MKPIKLTDAEVNALRLINDPEKEFAKVPQEQIDSLIAKGLLYYRPDGHLDVTDLGDDYCEEHFDD